MSTDRTDVVSTARTDMVMEAVARIAEQNAELLARLANE